MKKTIIALSALAIIFTSCKKEEEIIEEKVVPTDVSFEFKQYYGNSEVTLSDFGVTQYTNAMGTNHTISKLQYLVSNITLHKSDGSTVNLGGYNFVDLEDPLSQSYTPTTYVPEGSYSGISVTFGFDENDNITGAYTDLNAVSWSWPEMIGGGYHFMKFEGMFTDNTGSSKGFAYHMGTASKVIGNARKHEANHFRVRLWDFGGGFQVKTGEKVKIGIKMDISEWFKNPIEWDLNEYNSMLMPNYTAQKMMLENGPSVLKLGGVTIE